MLPGPERWCALSPALRVLCWLLFTLMMAVLSWAYWLHPFRQSLTIQQAQSHLQRQQLVTRWHTVLPLKVPHELPNDGNAPASLFSPLDFQTTATRLIDWQPAAKGGTLVLESDWQPVPDIFATLAQQNMMVTAFSLEPSGERLRFTLQLEKNDEQ